ncbi:MAG TPA: rhomboid family intramembrane serine protease, partial [Steroidobacteraceae bacterium]|nr:rhomboid family intramembrane serine protease [Steroidobacteraceae bacterium]
MMNAQNTAVLLILILTSGLSALGLFVAPQFIEHNLFRPYWFLRKRQYDTVIMSGFVHADLAHLAFNMITFYSFGRLLEQRIGTVLFVILYVAGLLLSELGTYLKQRNNPDYATLGASGAISAVLFASIVYFPGQSVYVFVPIPIPAPLFAIGYLAYTYYSARHPHGRINHDAHLGGA